MVTLTISDLYVQYDKMKVPLLHCKSGTFTFQKWHYYTAKVALLQDSLNINTC